MRRGRTRLWFPLQTYISDTVHRFKKPSDRWSLRTIFIQRLPVSIRSILASSIDSSDNLALMADTICEFSSPKAHTFENFEVNRPATQISQLVHHVARLTALVEAFTTSSHAKSFQWLGARSRTHVKKNLCWYHSKFTAKTKKCIQSCAFKKQQSMPENN